MTIATESQRHFTLKFGLHQPERSTIKGWKEKNHASGSLVSNQKGQGRPISAAGDENVTSILTSIENYCQTSMRRLSSETGASKSTVQRMIAASSIRKWKPK